MFLLEIALITGLYCFVIMPLYTIICAIIRSKYKSDIKLASRRAAVIEKTAELQRRFEETNRALIESEALFKVCRQNTKKTMTAVKKKKKKRKKKPKERYDIEIITD